MTELQAESSQQTQFIHTAFSFKYEFVSDI